MEPSIEVAPLVVSYLWTLHELFPAKSRVAEFETTTLESDIATRIGSDVAMAIRLADVAWRRPQERWVADGTDLPPEDDFDRLLNAARNSRRVTLKKWQTWTLAQVQESVQSLRSVISNARSTSIQIKSEDLASAAAELIRPFSLHAVYLVQTFGDIALNEGAPRELAARQVAATLLEDTDHQLFARTARSLNYRPLLLRALDTDSGQSGMTGLVTSHDPLFDTSEDPLVNEIRNRIHSGDHHEAVTALLRDPRYPSLLTAICDRVGQPVPFPLVQHRELDEIQLLRRARRDADREPAPSQPRQLAAVRAFNSGLLGVCLSGGGIRSATFNLGVLQSMATHKWLRHIDYLSTVSGGGYIGGWLLGWIKRRGSISSVEDSLRGSVSLTEACTEPAMSRNPDPATEHVRPIRLLREYSNYLAPSPGLLSADTWTMFGIWFRNTSLNLMVLGLFFMGALMVPRLSGLLMSNRIRPMLAWPLSAVCFWWASLFIGLNLDTFDAGSKLSRLLRVGGREDRRGDGTPLILLTIVTPLIAGAVLATAALWSTPPPVEGSGEPWFWHSWQFRYPTLIFTIGIVITSVIGFWSAPRLRGSRNIERTRLANLGARALSALTSTLYGSIAAIVGGVLTYFLWFFVSPVLAEDSQSGVWMAAVFGPSALLAVMTCIIVLYLGLEGYGFPDERREWWSRLGAWIGLLGAGWLTIASISLFAPLYVAAMGLRLAAAGVGWTAIVATGVSLASGGKSNGINLKLDKNLFTSLLIKVAPVAFAFGFFTILSVTASAGLFMLWRAGLIGRSTSALPPLPFALQRYVDLYWSLTFPADISILVIAFLLVLLSAALAQRVDVNEFSMHHFYRNRLVRAYLGASRLRAHRKPSAFTGFDLDDDIKLWRFRHDDEAVPNDVTSDCREGYCGPYPVINATLNTMAGENLAWQERKGQSFVFSPLYAGYDFASKQTALAEHTREQFAYRPSGLFIQKRERLESGGFGIRTSVAPDDRERGYGIGTTVAISGAAANPNSGYHTSPAVTFLLTVLNARLGWWVRNPRMCLDSKGPQTPRTGLIYLLSELFGFTGTSRTYLNLSDGGHFDNMGLYELIRRRCRFIIVCDAEEDDASVFEGMAGAIRKCRIDFGVTIDLDLDKLRRRRNGTSSQHAVVGTITYPYGVGCGAIVYLKASMTGDEPADVLEYKKLHQAFPHQTTADQFFDESQFESYRALGQFIGDGLFPMWPSAEPVTGDPQATTYVDDLKRAFDGISRRANKGSAREARME